MAVYLPLVLEINWQILQVINMRPFLLQCTACHRIILSKFVVYIEAKRKADGDLNPLQFDYYMFYFILLSPQFGYYVFILFNFIQFG